MLIELDSDSSGSENYQPFRPGQQIVNPKAKPENKPSLPQVTFGVTSNKNSAANETFPSENQSDVNNSSSNSKNRFSFGLKNNIINKPIEKEEPKNDPFLVVNENNDENDAFEMKSDNSAENKEESHQINGLFEIESSSSKSESPTKQNRRSPVRLITNPIPQKPQQTQLKPEDIFYNPDPGIKVGPKRLLFPNSNAPKTSAIFEPSPKREKVEPKPQSPKGKEEEAEEANPFEIEDDFIINSDDEDKNKEPVQNQPSPPPPQQQQDNTKPRRFLLNNLVKSKEEEKKEEEKPKEKEKEIEDQKNDQPLPEKPRRFLLNNSILKKDDIEEKKPPQEPPEKPRSRLLLANVMEKTKEEKQLTPSEPANVKQSNLIEFPALPDPPKVHHDDGSGTRIPKQLILAEIPSSTATNVNNSQLTKKEEEHENVFDYPKPTSLGKVNYIAETFPDVDDENVTNIDQNMRKSLNGLEISRPSIHEVAPPPSRNKPIQPPHQHVQNDQHDQNIQQSQNSNDLNNTPQHVSQKPKNPAFNSKPLQPTFGAAVPSRLFDEHELKMKMKQQKEANKRPKPTNIFGGQVSESLFSGAKKPANPPVPQLANNSSGSVASKNVAANPIPSFLEREEKRREELSAEAAKLFKKGHGKKFKRKNKNSNKKKKSKKNKLGTSNTSTSNRRLLKAAIENPSTASASTVTDNNDARVMKDIQSRLKVIKLSKEQEQMQILSEEKIKQQDLAEKQRIAQLQQEKQIACKQSHLRSQLKARQIMSKREQLERQREAMMMQMMERADHAEKRKAELLKMREKEMAKRNAQIWMKQKLMAKQREENQKMLELERVMKLRKTEERQQKIDLMMQERLHKQKLQKQTIESILMTLE